jgi:hypothetical protein
MSETEETGRRQKGPARNPMTLYIVVAVLLLVIIIVVVVLIVTKGIPALQGNREPTAVTQGGTTVTPVPTFTAGPTRPPTDTPLPAPSPTIGVPAMVDPDTPIFELASAAARPSTEWTGFFGQVLDAQGKPLAGVPLIIWYSDPEGRPAELLNSPDSPIARTDADGSYEMQLASAPYQGTWTIQVLTDDGGPASKLFTFETSDNPETGFQQIQVIWKKLP